MLLVYTRRHNGDVGDQERKVSLLWELHHFHVNTSKNYLLY